MMPLRTPEHERRKALVTLLSSLFNDEELRRFISLELTDGQQLASQIGWNAPLFEVCFQVAGLLDRQRALGDLWSALWEQFPRRRGEIAAVERMFVWRYVPNNQKIRVLLVVADVDPRRPLDLEAMVQQIQTAVDATKNGAEFEFHIRRTPTWDDCLDALLDIRPHVVQFNGHCSRRGHFSFSDGNGGVDDSVTPEMLGGLLVEQLSDVVLTLLNACYSQKIVQYIGKHMDYVIGMQEALYEASALDFTRVFYKSLARVSTIPEAFALGANEIKRYEQGSVPQINPTRAG